MYLVIFYRFASRVDNDNVLNIDTFFGMENEHKIIINDYLSPYGNQNLTNSGVNQTKL